ncbi:MAG: glycosyltransferase family 4 protein, partial [Candidatus Micrarchaeota archaeon]
GGLATHCYYLTRELAAQGVEIDFFMPRTKEPVAVPWARVVQVDCSSFNEFGTKVGFTEFGPYYPFCKQGNAGGRQGGEAQSNSGGLGFFDAVRKYNCLCAKLVELYNARKPYDLIHCHDWITFQAGAEASRACRVPMVATIHSTEYDRTGNLWPFDWILGIEQRGLRSADLVLTVSNRMARQLEQRFGVPTEKIRVLYNAIEAAPFNKSARREEFGFAPDAKVVLYNARLSIQKGPEFFVRAACRVLEKEPRARFIVSGSGDLLPRLTELAAGLGIADKLKFVGFTPFDETPVLYAVSDVYVLPSVSEPFGITVLEAMASGTPVIVSKTSGVSEVVRHCLTVDFWDVDEIASKILGVLRYAALRDEMGSSGRAEARQFSWDKVASETKWFYGQALAGGASSA